MIELHTGAYANLHLMLFTNLPKMHNSIKTLEQSKSHLKEAYENSLIELKNAAKEAKWLGLEVAAGHGLNYANLKPIFRNSRNHRVKYRTKHCCKSNFHRIRTSHKGYGSTS